MLPGLVHEILLLCNLRLDDGITPHVLLEMTEGEIDSRFTFGGAKILKKTLRELQVHDDSILVCGGHI